MSIAWAAPRATCSAHSRPSLHRHLRTCSSRPLVCRSISFEFLYNVAWWLWKFVTIMNENGNSVYHRRRRAGWCLPNSSSMGVQQWSIPLCFRLTQKSFFMYTFSFPLYFFFPVPGAQTQHLANARHTLYHWTTPIILSLVFLFSWSVSRSKPHFSLSQKINFKTEKAKEDFLV